MDDTQVRTVEQKCPDFYKEKIKVKKKPSAVQHIRNFINNFLRLK